MNVISAATRITVFADGKKGPASWRPLDLFTRAFSLMLLVHSRGCCIASGRPSS
jgi:hypothetical protein